MKKQDIALGQEYAIYAANARFDRTKKARFTVESLAKPTHRYSERGKVWGEIWAMGFDREWGWASYLVPLNQIQEPFEAWEAEDKARRERGAKEREESARRYAENERKSRELVEWLEEHKEELEAIGLPAPRSRYGWGLHAVTSGTVNFALSQEQLEALLERARVTA
jgi:hypothetical protein